MELIKASFLHLFFLTVFTLMSMFVHVTADGYAAYAEFQWKHSSLRGNTSLSFRWRCILEWDGRA